MIFFDFFFPFLFLLVFICLSTFSFIDFLHIFNNFVFSSVGTALFQAVENLGKKEKEKSTGKKINNTSKKKKQERNKERKKQNRQEKQIANNQFQFHVK